MLAVRTGFTVDHYKHRKICLTMGDCVALVVGTERGMIRSIHGRNLGPHSWTLP